jgi:hypothetical protein
MNLETRDHHDFFDGRTHSADKVIRKIQWLLTNSTYGQYHRR